MIEVYPEMKDKTGLTDEVLKRKMAAIEQAIKGMTHNEFRGGYPPDVVEGANGMLLWDATYRDKTGIKSETIARHSVTYDAEAANTATGYPDRVTGFLKPYRKARF